MNKKSGIEKLQDYQSKCRGAIVTSFVPQQSQQWNLGHIFAFLTKPFE